MDKYKISIIVPVYNVEAYLDECISSIVNQTFGDYEVIFINDGSLDSSQAIIEKYCERFINFKIINQDNSGSAGGPRNRGILEARGEYIFFLDPDDKLPCTALERLVSAAERSNSEIICGSYSNFKNNSSWSVRHVMEDIFYDERITCFNESKELMRNLIAWNKLYKREFIYDNKILFDETIRYGEDRIFVLNAYVLAKSIHIIPECIYYYRIRSSTSNISAVQTYKIGTFRESIYACKKDKEIFEKNNILIKLSELYGKERIYHDFIRFIDYYGKNNLTNEEWEEVLEIASEYINLFENDYSNASYVQKRKIKYIKERNINELIEYLNLKHNIYKIIKENNRVIIKDCNCKKYDKNKYIEKASISDLNPFYKINSIAIKENILNIQGWAYIHRYITYNSKSLNKYLVFKGVNGIKEYSMKSKITPLISLEKGKGIYSYLYSGFEGNVTLRDLCDIVDKDNTCVKIYLKLCIDENLYSEVYIQDLDIYNHFFNTNQFDTINQRIESIVLYDDSISMKGWAFIENFAYKNKEEIDKNLILIDRTNNSEFKYKLDTYDNAWCNKSFEVNPYSNDYGFSGWSLKIPYYELPNGIYDIYLEISCGNICVRDKLKYPSYNLARKARVLEYGKIVFNRLYKFELSTNEYNRSKSEFILRVQDVNSSDYAQNGGPLHAIGQKSDYYNIDINKEDLLLKRIAVTSEYIKLYGTYIYGDKNPSKIIILEDENGTIKEYNCEEYEFNCIKNQNSGWSKEIKYNIKEGRYKVKIKVEDRIYERFRLTNNLRKNTEVWQKNHFIKRSKVRFVKNQDLNDNRLYSVELIIDKSNKNLIKGTCVKVINRFNKIISKKFKKSKIFKFKNEQFRSKIYLLLYRMFKILPVDKNKITMVSYKQVMPADYLNFYKKVKTEYPNINIEFVGGNQKSMFQYINMAFRFATSSSILIDNYYRHLYNVKHRKDTKFIQVWHATGIFKRFALLAEGKEQVNSTEFEINAHHYYTHVIVSGNKVVKPYAEAFGLPESKVLPIGVSRTDELFDEEEKKKIKAKLLNMYPVMQNKKIILYAPTFRGDDNERKVFRNQMEFEKMRELKDAGYILLVKLHPAVQEPIMIQEGIKDFVYDITQYPNINDLFFIADILITDYSSSIFEFSLLKKPSIFFAYDLDMYLNERGFYYDYEKFVPGPICKRTDEIVECVKNIDNIKFNYDEFTEEYMNGCDGHATERLVNLVMDKEER